MKQKSFFQPVGIILGMIIVGCILSIFGCSSGGHTPSGQASNTTREEVVYFTGNGLMKESRMSLSQMLELPNAHFEHRYSLINNWPNEKILVARGVKISEILKAAGIKDEAKCILVKGEDGYECSYTREQLLETKRFYFPGVREREASRAELVEPIIAYEYMEDSEQLSEARADRLCLIMPQAYVNEQNQHSFVKAVSEIHVTVDDPGKWEVATVYPPAGNIKKGDSVKLQHKHMGKVKMYYTLDGSMPGENATLYNPSTYQPELNQPIVINQDTCIKVVVKGFGKYDSDMAEYHYQIK